MMRSSFTFMKVRGIEIGAHWTWLLVAGLVVWSLAAALFPTAYPGLDGSTYIAMGVAAALLLFGSVLLHELGHAFRAQDEGIHLEGITLWLFGGVAKLKGTPESAGAEFRVAIAGPLISLVLAGVFWGLALLGEQLTWPVPLQGVLDYLAVINLLVLGFNLIPALPLDGGRVLRSWLWHRQRSFIQATRTAAGAGQLFGYVLIGIGILTLFTGGGFGGLWFAFIGWFLVQAAQSEAEAAEVRSTLRGVRVRDIMEPNPVVVPPDLTVAQFLDTARSNPRFSTYPVASDGGFEGVISLRSATSVPLGEQGLRRVREVMAPREQVPTVGPDTEVFDVLQLLGEARRAVVVDGGRVVGVLSAYDIARAIEVEQARRPRREPGARPAGPLVWIVVGLLILVAAGFLYRPPLLVVSPGGTFEVGGDVTIRGVETTELRGRFLATTVQLHQPTAIGALIAGIRPDREVVSTGDVLPEGVPPERYAQLQRAAFQQSRQVAAAAAARAVGLPVNVRGTGVEVVQVVSGGPAAGALQAGDVIVAVNGRRVGTVEDLRELVGSQPVGSAVRLAVERGGNRVAVEVRTARLPALSEGPGLGILAQTRDLAIDLPFQVEFREREQVGGPSAGLVYALAIADLLAETDYAGGRTIAATGTIQLDGDVGPVGGVAEKLEAAEDAGAGLLLVPEEEVQAVVGGGEGVTVRGVGDLEEALRLLAPAA